MINRVILKNFRNHSDTEIDCTRRYTLLLGPTGAGKTGVLYGVAYCLLGANSLTTADGKHADGMIRAGADQLEVSLDIEGWGTVTRTKNGKYQKLMVPGSDSDSAVSNQPLVLARFGVSHETLVALLDPKPLLTRTAVEQKEILLRTLRPTVIPTSQSLQAAGIKQICGVEHLGNLIIEWKTVKLRDLNRDRKKMEAQTSQGSPDWPYPNYTEAGLRALLDTRIAERDTLLEEEGGLRAKVEADQAALDMPVPQVEGLLSDDELQALERLQEQLRQEHLELTKAGSALHNKQVGNKISLDTHKTEIERLSRLEFTKHCETCTCPVEQRTKDRDLRMDELGKNLRADDKVRICLAAAARKNAGETAVIVAAMTDAEAKRTAHTAAAKAREAIAALEPAEAVSLRLKQHKELLATTSEQRAAKEAEIQKGRLCAQRIDEYNRDLAASQEHARRYAALVGTEIPNTERVIRELETLRESLIRENIGQFLSDMQAFVQPFGLGNITYDWDAGFFVDGLPASRLSDGQAVMIFEAAFRIATARKTKIPFLVFDNKSPVDEKSQYELSRALFGSGLQILQTWTTNQRPPARPVDGVSRYWLESQQGVCVTAANDR